MKHFRCCTVWSFGVSVLKPAGCVVLSVRRGLYPARLFLDLVLLLGRLYAGCLQLGYLFLECTGHVIRSTEV